MDTRPPSDNGSPESSLASAPGGMTPVRLALGLVAGIGGAAVGALVYAGISYGSIRWLGAHLIGINGLAAGACVGMAMARTAGRARVLALAASTLALLAGVAGCILWMRLGTGKDFATLFQPGAERQATYNTMFNLWQYIAYAIAAFTAYYCAMPRERR